MRRASRPDGLTAQALEAAVGETLRRSFPGLLEAISADTLPPGGATSDDTPDNKIEAGSGSSDPEEPMYRWISSKPYRHHDRFRVWFKTLDGKRSFETFDDLEAATSFLSRGARRTLRGGGHAVGDLLEKYLASRTELRPSSIVTLRARLGAMFQERRAMPVEAFPWLKAWNQHVAGQSVDSQHGVAGALRGFFGYCRTAGFLKSPPELPEIKGRKRRGKMQLRIDEARKLIAEALRRGDPFALAAATVVLTGLRPGEIMGLRVRDCDDGAAVLWVEAGKTAAARRAFELAVDLRPFLLRLAHERPAMDWLFAYKRQRRRVSSLTEGKAGTDALLRRVRQLCTEAGVPVVVPHSLRGLHATLAAGFGATSHVVAAALGHTSFAVTERHYVDQAALASARSRRTRDVLSGNWSEKAVTGEPESA